MQWPYKDLEQQASGMGMNKLLVLTRKTIATQIIIACSNSASSMPACVKITSRESNRAALLCFACGSINGWIAELCANCRLN